MTSERSTELRNRADLIMAWEAFEPGMEAPAPLDYEDTACKLVAAAEEIEKLRAALKPFADMAEYIEREHPGWYHRHFMFTDPQIKMTWLIDARQAHA